MTKFSISIHPREYFFNIFPRSIIFETESRGEYSQHTIVFEEYSFENISHSLYKLIIVLCTNMHVNAL